MNRQKAKKIVIGLILLALGIAWLGSAVNLWDFNVFFPDDVLKSLDDFFCNRIILFHN